MNLITRSLIPVKQLISAALIVSVAACGDDPIWPGKYQVTGAWNLSGPLANDRTVGDAIADLLVEKIVGASGVPSLIQDKVEELVSETVRDSIKTVVDANVPAELAPDGAVTQALAASLADVTLESTLELEEGLLPGALEGTELVTALVYDNDGTPERIEPSELFPGSGIYMDAEWEGKESGDGALEIEPHGLNIQYGQLVANVTSKVVEAADQPQLETEVYNAVDCTNIVAGILDGGSSFNIGYGDWNVSLKPSDLSGACDAAQTLVHDRVLGMFAIDAKVEVGGVVTYTDSDGDGRAESLASASGFGGILTVAPPVIAPKITVSFMGTR